MKISRLIELDTQAQAKITLPDSFGDSYLVSKNSLYAHIRTRALAAGYKYSNLHNNSFNVLGLSQLENILKDKTIPYVDNVSVLKNVEKQIPNTCDWDEVVDNLKKNYVFHESCHAVGRSTSDKIFTGKLSQKELVTKLLAEESFANTCELLGILDVNDSAHRLFYEANSYCYMETEKTNIKNLVQDLGFDFIFYFTLINYMYSNFLYEKISEKNIESVVNYILKNQLAVSKQKNLNPYFKRLRLISHIGLDLNPRFRFVTTGFYFHLNKISIKNNELPQINFMQVLETNELFGKFFKDLKTL